MIVKMGLKETQPLAPGETVRVRTDNEKSWCTVGTVTDQVAPRSYNVATDQGTYRRNAKHIMPDKGIEKANITSEAKINVPVNLPDKTPTIQRSGYTTRSGREVKPVEKLTLEMSYG